MILIPCENLWLADAARIWEQMHTPSAWDIHSDDDVLSFVDRYVPATDTITVPDIDQFTETAEFYSTLYHEMTHSTGHVSRLNRLTSTAFASNTYSQEELVAELGSAFLVHHAGLETASSFRNSAAYLRGWLNALHDDKRLIVKAAGQADKAVRLILGEEDDDE
jgi:antirestriction protein ArdC